VPINKILDGITDFHDHYFASHRELFEHLSHGQNPEILFITCSDSRIDPFLITQSQPGDLFVIRNVGNIIPAYSPINGAEAAGIEYALTALNVKDIVICGHSHCGAMKGLIQINSLSEKMPSVYNWLRIHGEPTQRLVKDNYKDYPHDQLLKITIEQNVLTQIDNLETYPVVRSKIHSGLITIHAWIYEIESGVVFAYDSNSGKFEVLANHPFPVLNPLISLHPE
jgi:carbonic anhydrase